jgi:hypothetical protein
MLRNYDSSAGGFNPPIAVPAQLQQSKTASKKDKLKRKVRAAIGARQPCLSALLTLRLCCLCH